MQHRTFDRLARNLGAQSTRRGFLGGIGALFAAGFATTALGQRRAFEATLASAADDLEEQSVLLFEELGRIADEHEGTCRALNLKVNKLQEKHKDLVDDILANEATWTDDYRAEHADRYGDRRLVVVDQIKGANASCTVDAADLETPMSVPAVSASPSAGSSPEPIGMDHDAMHGLASQSGEACTPDNTNFYVSAYCWNDGSGDDYGGWTSPIFQWPAYCASNNIDGNCQLCPTGFDNLGIYEVCSKYWSDKCLDGDDDDHCQVKYHDIHGGITSADCSKADPNKVISNKQNKCYDSRSDWSSPVFTWSQFCPKGYVDHDCIDCQSGFDNLQGPDVCAKYWPQDCVESGRNYCYIGFHVDDNAACCHDQCPQSTGACYSSGGLAVGMPGCGICMLEWCGPTSHCLSACENNDCCYEPCNSSSYEGTDSPAVGEARTGTPVPLGTPDGTPGVPPTTAPTSAPTMAPTIVPTSPPTELPTEPPTEVPTEPPGTPNASPSV